MIPMPDTISHPFVGRGFFAPLVTMAMSGFTFAVTVGHALQSTFAAMAAVGAFCVGVSSLGGLAFRVYLYAKHGDRPGVDKGRR